MHSIDVLCQQLRAQGRRITPQRRAIIQALLEDGSHPTAEQIYTRVRKGMPDLSQATVYNTLHELVEVGILAELDLGLGERRYDITTTAHAHMVCLGCGQIYDVHYDCNKLALSLEHVNGFQILDCAVILRGYCANCTPELN